MKKLLFSLVMVLTALTAAAIPAKKGVKVTLTLTDGTQVVTELRGDEFGHFYEAEDGRIFVESETPNVFMLADKMQVIKKQTQEEKRAT